MQDPVRYCIQYWVNFLFKNDIINDIQAQNLSVIIFSNQLYVYNMN